MSRTETGRSLLRRWDDTRPTSFYTDDEYLRATLALRLGPERLARIEPALRQAGEDSAGPVNLACSIVDRPENLPRLERWNGIGERIEEIVFHPAYHDIGRLVWRSGILAVLGERTQLTWAAGSFASFRQSRSHPTAAGGVNALHRSTRVGVSSQASS